MSKQDLSLLHKQLDQIALHTQQMCAREESIQQSCNVLSKGFSVVEDKLQQLCFKAQYELVTPSTVQLVNHTRTSPTK